MVPFNFSAYDPPPGSKSFKSLDPGESPSQSHGSHGSDEIELGTSDDLPVLRIGFNDM